MGMDNLLEQVGQTGNRKENNSKVYGIEESGKYLCKNQ